MRSFAQEWDHGYGLEESGQDAALVQGDAWVAGAELGHWLLVGAVCE